MVPKSRPFGSTTKGRAELKGKLKRNCFGSIGENQNQKMENGSLVDEKWIKND